MTDAIWRAAFKRAISCQRLPITCTPIGRPSGDRPIGIVTRGFLLSLLSANKEGLNTGVTETFVVSMSRS